MSRTVRVFCRDCDETGTAPDGYACTMCVGQHHLDVDSDDVAKEGFIEWVDHVLPEPPNTVWTLSHPRCIP